MSNFARIECTGCVAFWMRPLVKHPGTMPEIDLLRAVQSSVNFKVGTSNITLPPTIAPAFVGAAVGAALCNPSAIRRIASIH
jgi:hypothetical protein